MLHIVNYAPDTVNGRPLIFHKQVWTNEKKTREIRKSGFVFVVKLNIVNVKKVFFSFPRECCILLILPQTQSMVAPGTPKVILDQY